MRIAYLSADHGIPVGGDKGAAIHIQEMLRAFLAAGHDVELLAARIGAGAERLPVPARKIRPPLVAVEPAADDEAGSSRLAKEQRYLAIAEAVQAELTLAHRERPFDLVYERYALWSVAGVRAGRALGLPVILEVNAPLLLEQARWRQLAQPERAAAIEREAFTSADLVVAVSAEVADYVVSRGAERARVVVEPNGVDLERFRPDVAPLDVPAARGRRVVGFMGGLRPWHGLEPLMAAFREVALRLPDTHLLIVGDGPLRGWVEGFAAGADLADRVTVTGWLDHAQLPAALARIDVATAPYPELDGFYFSPLKLYEYMACGRAVVASRIGQIATAVADGVDGLLVEPGDPHALAGSLIRVLDDAALRKRLGVAAADASRVWGWQAKASRIVGLVPARAGAA